MAQRSQDGSLFCQIGDLSLESSSLLELTPQHREPSQHMRPYISLTSATIVASKGRTFCRRLSLRRPHPCQPRGRRAAPKLKRHSQSLAPAPLFHSLGRAPQCVVADDVQDRGIQLNRRRSAVGLWPYAYVSCTTRSHSSLLPSNHRCKQDFASGQSTYSRSRRRQSYSCSYHLHHHPLLFPDDTLPHSYIAQPMKGRKVPHHCPLYRCCCC